MTGGEGAEEVSTIILGMLESSGFPKSDSVILSASLSWSMSLYLCSLFIFLLLTFIIQLTSLVSSKMDIKFLRYL